jgi:hypothetical protein
MNLFFPYTTHLFVEYFSGVGLVLSLSRSNRRHIFTFYFSMKSLQYIHPRFISSCSTYLELHALSKHWEVAVFWFFFSSFGLYADGCRLLTELSSISVANLNSWVLAGDMTADVGILSLSGNMYNFVQPSLLLSIEYYFLQLTPSQRSLYWKYINWLLCPLDNTNCIIINFQ